MRLLIVKTHPRADGFCTAVTAAVERGLVRSGHEYEVLDLYAENFNPLLSEDEWENHLADPATKPDIAEHVRRLRWAQGLIFVHPTWWSGPPAMLDGWLQRVLVHGVAFSLRSRGPIRGELKWIRRLAVVTTHGSPRWVNFGEGHVGRVRLLRGLRTICHPLTRTTWMAFYKIDHSTDAQRRTFLTDVEEKFAKFK